MQPAYLAQCLNISTNCRAGVAPITSSCRHPLALIGRSAPLHPSNAACNGINSLKAMTLARCTHAGIIACQCVQACKRAGLDHEEAEMFEVNGTTHIGILSSKKLQHILSDILELDLDQQDAMERARSDSIHGICQHLARRHSILYRSGRWLRNVAAEILPHSMAAWLRRRDGLLDALQRSGVCPDEVQ